MAEQQVGPIAICVHVFERIDFDVYFNHLWCVANWALRHKLVFVGKSGLDAANARNSIVERCFEKDCSHALFIDGDHLVPLSALDLLLENGREAIVSGLVCKKGDEYQQVVWEIHRKGGKEQFYQVELPLDGRVYEASVCAFGCTLINLAKLRKLKKPYFRDTCVPNDTDVPINQRSDINICRAFTEIGEKVWVDTRVLVGHLGVPRAVFPQGAKLFGKLIEIENELKKLREGQMGNYYLPS